MVDGKDQITIHKHYLRFKDLHHVQRTISARLGDWMILTQIYILVLVVDSIFKALL